MQVPKSRLAEIAFPALPTPRAAMLLAVLQQLEHSQWWPPERMRQHQLAQLWRVLAHATRTVPYHRSLWQHARLELPAAPKASFLERIPVSARSMVQAAGDALHSKRRPASHGRTQATTTSGSTGQPVTIHSTALTRFLARAFALREHLWHRRDFRRKLASIRWVPKGGAAAPHGLHYPNWGDIVEPVFASGPACLLNVASPVEAQVAWLKREAPAYLLSFPSNFAALARYCLQHGTRLPGLQHLRTIGETLTEANRRLYREAWGCEAVDVYSCEEAGYLALQCPAGGGYHVQSENVLLEVVDDEGRACRPGETGRVLISSLHNFTTPLVRYELGDCAELGGPCGCGRGLPLLARVHGRTRNRLALPDGRSEFPYLGEHGMVERATGVNVRAFQFVQLSLEEIEVKLVCDRQFTPPEAATLERLVQKNLGHPFRIRFTYWEEIPKGPRGKFEEFVSNVT